MCTHWQDLSSEWISFTRFFFIITQPRVRSRSHLDRNNAYRETMEPQPMYAHQIFAWWEAMYKTAFFVWSSIWTLNLTYKSLPNKLFLTSGKYVQTTNNHQSSVSSICIDACTHCYWIHYSWAHVNSMTNWSVSCSWYVLCRIHADICASIAMALDNQSIYGIVYNKNGILGVQSSACFSHKTMTIWRMSWCCRWLGQPKKERK